jgi:hypothetical protein
MNTKDNELSIEISECCSIHTSVDAVLSGEIIRGFGSIETTVSTKESMAIVRENSVDSKLSSAISAEDSSRVAGDLSLANAISREEGRIDAILDGSTVDLDQFAEIVSFVNGIDLENDNALLFAVTSIGSAIGNEESSRVSADSSLASVINGNKVDANNAISAEASTREVKDASLETVIATNRTDANTAISNEESARISKDNSLEVFIGMVEEDLMSQLSSEISRAEAAEDSLESALSTEVSNLISNTDLTAIDSFSEVVAELSAITNDFENTYFKKVVVSGLVNGTNKNFTLASDVRTNSEAIYYNGLLQEAGVDYTISGGVNVNFTYTPATGGKVTAYGVYA